MKVEVKCAPLWILIETKPKNNPLSLYHHLEIEMLVKKKQNPMGAFSEV